MSATSSIEWTDKTWNPVRGCSVISPGCVNCYAMKTAHRFSGAGGPYEGLTKPTSAGPQWTGIVRPVESSLLEPLSWRKPQRIFVNSMSDLFHEDVPDDFILRVFEVMERAKQHTFHVLTKRPERMLDVLGGSSGAGLSAPPLPNVWLGISVENRHRRSRIDKLRQMPAAVRFVSFEPLLEDVSDGLDLTGIDWAIWGGESGPRARPSQIDWYRRGIASCRRQGVAPFMKQVGSRPDGWWTNELGPRFNRHALHDRKGGTPEEWPEDLRVREFPAVHP